MASSGRVIEFDNLPGSVNSVRFDGHAHGASVSFLIAHNQPRSGPKLHKHPYEETFVILEGEGLFIVGDEELKGVARQIVVVPAETPHKFVNTGEDRLRMVNIHPRQEIEQEWLEEA